MVDPASAAVVAAIVTSRLGVLVGRRVDGIPPWAFIGGKVEPGETPAEAAVREVAEETGLAVEAVEPEIGHRIHPTTGRLMVYVACRATGDLTVQVCDHSLAEVRWVALADLEELLPGLFTPVDTYLRKSGSAG
jgi:8-oxo-dGTP diphosphatase